MMRTFALFTVALGLLLALAGACNGREGTPSDEATPTSEPEVFDFEALDEPPPLDAAGYCGNVLIETQDTRKNLYFVVDRSSSMANELEGSELNRFESVREAIAGALVDIGYLVHYGGAAFPGPQGGCDPGVEVFPTTKGDPVGFSATDTVGPVLSRFLEALTGDLTRSGTPLSATLEALTPALLELSGDSFVIVATDGHPNCNPGAECGIDQCYYNMLPNWEIGGRECDDSWNCCADDDPDLAAAGVDGPIQCVDRDATLSAIRTLADEGVRTFVIGLPDSFAFEELLNAMAVTGGTSQPGDVQYFPAESGEALSQQLRKIAAQVAVSCQLELDEAPPDPNMVNVYLDATPLPQDEQAGWSYTSSSSIQIHGEACDSLLSGDILNVQIVAGCPTEIH